MDQTRQTEQTPHQPRLVQYTLAETRLRIQNALARLELMQLRTSAEPDETQNDTQGSTKIHLY